MLLLSVSNEQYHRNITLYMAKDRTSSFHSFFNNKNEALLRLWGNNITHVDATLKTPDKVSVVVSSDKPHSQSSAMEMLYKIQRNFTSKSSQVSL